MRRLLPILMMLVVCLTAGGSPNPYGISDECYKLFLKADSLIDGCSFEDTDNGWIAIGKNGNSIFIPATGVANHNGKIAQQSKSGGFYWSSKKINDFYSTPGGGE